ncbi:MAG: PAS domain S-box protein [Bacteroidetes bacterium]|nr:PAS domain S-box protein [Bacteroidota bacterium]
MKFKRQIILKYLSLIGIGASVFQLVFFLLFVQSFFWAGLCVLVGFCFFAVFWLNKSNRFNIARFVYFLFSVLSILMFGLFLGEGSGMQYYYIPLVSLLFVLYQSANNKKTITFFLSYMMVAVGLLFWLEGRWSFIDIPASSQGLLNGLNFYTCLIISVLAIYYLISVTQKIEDDLFYSQSYLKAVYDSSTEAKFLIGKNMEIIDFNKSAFQQVLAVLKTEINKGDSVLQYVSPEIHSVYIENYNRCIKGEVVEYEREAKSQEGFVYYYEIKMTPVYNALDEIIGVSSRGLDVTQKRHTELELLRRKALLKSIVKELPDAIILTDAHTRKVASCNDSAMKLFQVDSEEELKDRIGKDFHKVPPTYKELKEVQASLAQKGVWKGEIEYVSSKGRNFWGSIVIKRIQVLETSYNLIRIADITYRVKERENMVAFLEMKKKQAATEAKQKNLSLMIHGQEQERQRFSKELHDGIGQVLTAIRLQVSALEIADISTFPIQKQKIKNTIDSTISEVKRISHNLMPSAIEDFGLTAALENLCQMVPHSMGATFENDPQMSDYKLSKKEQFAIYRIAQEAVNNAVKHSMATKIKVSFSVTNENEMLLKIEDNGKGFKQEKIMSFYESHTIGSGLNNMKERAELINARLSIESHSGEGTVVGLLLPLTGK